MLLLLEKGKGKINAKKEGTHYMWSSKGNCRHEIINVQKTDSGNKPVPKTKFKTPQLTNAVRVYDFNVWCFVQTQLIQGNGYET